MAFQDFTLAQLNGGSNTMPDFLGIEFTEIGEDFLCGKMPVNNHTVQPMRILHGGASVVFAETLGSVVGFMSLPNTKTHAVVGLEINANHIRSVKEGNWVYGKCTPIHVGRSTMICEIKITNEENKLVCSSRITLSVIPINS
jgi:1,4-dihydroxy-2-naphthoyl-CoA hydrolase